MSGYRDKEDKLPTPTGPEVKSFAFVTLAPTLVGFFMLVMGLGKGNYVLAGLGFALFVASPFIVRRVWQNL